MTLNEILNAAVPLWAQLTGTKLGTNTYTISFNNSEFQDHDLQKYVAALNDARVQDPTGTTAILLLRGLFETYVKEKSLRFHTLLYAADEVEETLGPLRAFHALVTQASCEEAIVAFRWALRSAATHYSYELPALQKILNDERALGELRLAASRSLVTLAIHQFTQGARDPKPLQYNRKIYEFSSINSFLHALRHQMVSGITLALIRSGDNCKAYFALGLRNGETITTLTDFQDGAHPEYHNMTRRPDRQLEERARQHWFPYRLLEEDPVKRTSRKHALVPLDAKAQAIAEISELEPSEFVWLILLFELIAAKFDRDDEKLPQLSYTGEMVVAPHALVAAQSALVSTGHYTPLVLPALTTTTTTAERAKNKPPLGHNAWLEERYRHRVPEILLDVVGDRQALHAGKAAQKLLPGDAHIEDLPRERQQPGVMRWGGRDLRKVAIEPMALDPSYFGTAADIEQTRSWYGRVNLINGVQRLATADFAAKQATILAWYRKRLERNLPFLWAAVARGSLIAPKTSWKSTEKEPFPTRDTLRWSTGNILQQKEGRDWYKTYGGTPEGLRFGKWNGRYFECAINPPSRASVFTLISPDNPRALALLMGIPAGKIPWPLQHWTTHEPYTGNSILQRIDPQDSQLDNPWRHLELKLAISLSKRAFNKLRKEYVRE